LYKVKKLIFKFVLDEDKKTIKSIDQYSQYWHGIFKDEPLEFKEEYSSKNENIYGCKSSTWYRLGGFDATVLYHYTITVSSAKGGMRITPQVYKFLYL